MKKVILLPWYFVQLFTMAKSFKSNPIIGSKVLNMMGLHVVRLVVSHGIMRFRMFCLSWDIPTELKKEYYEKGYILLEGVLSDEEYHLVVEEAKELRSEIRECIQGNTLTQRIHLDKENAGQTKAIQRLLSRNDIVKLFKFTAGKNHRPISHLQVIKSNYVKGEHDPQKNLHSDTFHPTMKYWYFLQDVKYNMAPFTYVVGSNKLTFNRLKWEYKKSITMDQEESDYSKNGSFRVEESEFEALGLGQPKSVYVPQNTLVIVNTFGFHRRGDTDKRSIRDEIWGISRTNPFNPCVGFDLDIFHALDNWGLKKLRQIKDKQAKNQGKHSAWHVIKSQNLYEDVP